MKRDELQIKDDRHALRKSFEEKGFGPAAYVRAYGLDAPTLTRVLDGKATGVNYRKAGKTRKIIRQLYIDGVWSERPSWLVEVEEEAS